MPTPLPTLASPTDPRAPAPTPHRPANPSASEASFSETLSETSGPATDDVAAIPSPAGEVAEASPESSGETPGTGQPTDAVAQETRDDAQVLSRILPVITTATGPTPAPTPDPVPGPAPTPDPVPEPAPTVNPDPLPTPVAPTATGAVVDPALQSSVTEVVRQPVPPPTVQDQPQLQPNPTSETPSVAPAVDDGQATTPETGRDAQSGDTENRQAAPPPATGRAIQVQTGVAVQNATGQAPLLASAGSPTGVPITTPANADLGLEDAPNTSARVVRGLTAMLNQRGGAMTMRLEPPSLGQLRVQMTVARGVVTAQFQPATIEAQALLERSLATLRTALESQGLSVERLTVHAAPATAAGREAAEDQSQQQQQQASRQQPDAGQGRSRGRGDEQPRDGRHGRRGTTNFAEAFENIGAEAA